MPQARTLISGLALGESPRWHDGRIWLCDWAAHEVVAVDLDGHREVVAQVDAFPFSIDWLPDGQLLIIAGDGRLLRRNAGGTTERDIDLAPLSDKPWNEIVVDGRGNTYLNNIGFDMMGGAAPADGMLAVVPSEGTPRRVADGLAFPNGMAITPDNRTPSSPSRTAAD